MPTSRAVLRTSVVAADGRQQTAHGREVSIRAGEHHRAQQGCLGMSQDRQLPAGGLTHYTVSYRPVEREGSIPSPCGSMRASAAACWSLASWPKAATTFSCRSAAASGPAHCCSSCASGRLCRSRQRQRGIARQPRVLLKPRHVHGLCRKPHDTHRCCCHGCCQVIIECCRGRQCCHCIALQGARSSVVSGRAAGKRMDMARAACLLEPAGL